MSEEKRFLIEANDRKVLLRRRVDGRDSANIAYQSECVERRNVDILPTRAGAPERHKVQRTATGVKIWRRLDRPCIDRENAIDT